MIVCLGSTALSLNVLILSLICRTCESTTGSSLFSLGSAMVLSSCGSDDRIVAIVRTPGQTCDGNLRNVDLKTLRTQDMAIAIVRASSRDEVMRNWKWTILHTKDRRHEMKSSGSTSAWRRVSAHATRLSHLQTQSNRVTCFSPPVSIRIHRHKVCDATCVPQPS